MGVTDGFQHSLILKKFSHLQAKEGETSLKTETYQEQVLREMM